MPRRIELPASLTQPPPPPPHLQGHPHALRLGMSWFAVPPTSILVDKIATTVAIPMIRSRGSVKSQSGHTDTRVSLEIVFPDLEAVNDPDNGLRALIAQFRRVPFVPVENTVLNSQGIYALALHNLTYSTIPNYPQAVHAQVVAFAFDAAVLLPDLDRLPDSTEKDLPEGVYKLRRLDRHFIWPLMRWYVHRDLMASGPADPPPKPLSPDRAAQLEPVLPESLNTFRLYAVSKEKAERIQELIKASYDPEQHRLTGELSNLLAAQEAAGTLFEALQAARNLAFDALPYYDEKRRFVVVELASQRLQRWWMRTWRFRGKMPALPERVRAVAVHLGLDFAQEGWKDYGTPWVDLMHEMRHLDRDGVITLGPWAGWYDYAVLVVPEKDGKTWKLVEEWSRLGKRPDWMGSALELLTKLQRSKKQYKDQVQDLQNRLRAIREGAGASEVDLSPDQEVDLPDLIPTRIQVSYTNQLGRLPIASRSQPIYQYLGGQDHLIQIELLATSHRGVVALNDAFERSQAMARNYRLQGTYSFMRLDNPILNLAGIRYVLLDTLTSATIEGYPDAYRLQLTLVNFDVVQRHRFRPQAIVGAVDPKTKKRRYTITSMTPDQLAALGLSGAAVVGGEIGSEKQGTRQIEWAMAKDLFRAIDAYPDLELPGWEDLRRAVGEAGSAPGGTGPEDPHGDLTGLSKEDRQRLLDYLRWREEDQTGDASGPGIFADPDFYVIPSGMELAEQIQKTIPQVIGDKGTWRTLVSYLDDPNPDDPSTAPPQPVTGMLDPHAGVVRPQTTSAASIPSARPAPPTPPPMDAQAQATLLRLARKATDLMLAADGTTRYPVRASLGVRVPFPELSFSLAQDGALLGAVGLALTQMRHADGTRLVTPNLSPPDLNRVGLFGLPRRLDQDLWAQLGFRQITDILKQNSPVVDMWNRRAKDAIVELMQGPRTGADGLDHTLTLAVALYWVLVDYFSGSGINGVGALPLNPNYAGRWGQDDAAWSRVRVTLQRNAEAAARFLADYPELLSLCIPSVWDLSRNAPSATLRSLVLPPRRSGGNPTLLGFGFKAEDLESGKWWESLRGRLLGNDYETFLARLLLVASGVANADGTLPDRPPAGAQLYLGRTIPLAKVLAAVALASFGKNNQLPRPLPKVGGQELVPLLRRLADQVASNSAFLEVAPEADHISTSLADLYRLPSPAQDRSPVEEAVHNLTYDLRTYRTYGRWVRAFPTFYAFVLDEGFPLIMWRRAWDNFYGFNALLSVKLHRSRESPVSTCQLEIANNYHTFVSASTAYLRQQLDGEQLSFWEILLGPSSEKVIKARSQPLWTFWISPGARLHLRMGYGSNVAALPVVFNGTVTEITTSDVVEVIAQGDGLELANAICPEEISTTDWWGRGERPERLLARLLQAGFERGLGQEIKQRIQVVTPFWFNPPVSHLGSLPFQLNNPYGLSEITQNIYPSYYSGVLGYEEGFGLWQASADPTLEIDLRGLSIWDVVALAARAVPGFVASVEPFDFRSTLFFGKPYWPMTFTYDVRMTTPSPEEKGWVRLYSPGSDQAIYLRPRRKAFAQYHLALSGYDLVKTDMRLSSDFYTGVVAGYRVTSPFGAANQLLGAWLPDKQIAVFADVFISPPFQKILMMQLPIHDRSSNVFTGIPWVGGVIDAAGNFLIGTLTKPWNYIQGEWVGHTAQVAQSVAAATLRDEVAKMYDGQILLVGDPTLKPYDYLYLLDVPNGFSGTLGVREVVHLFTPDTGLVSLVVPDALAVVPEMGSFVIHRIAGLTSALTALELVGGTTLLMRAIGLYYAAARPVAIASTIMAGLFLWGVGAYLTELARRSITATRGVLVFPISWYGIPWVAVLGQAGQTTVASIPVTPDGKLPSLPGVDEETMAKAASEVISRIPLAGNLIRQVLQLPKPDSK